ncbi:hypothetical protein [Halorubrum sp. GN11_10-6_MGM]|nr:hypothetical protein [Halorubrum sp. GN11_10-6_MGM]
MRLPRFATETIGLGLTVGVERAGRRVTNRRRNPGPGGGSDR